MAVLQSHLPYERGALEPHISRKTMSCHYDEYHRGYVRKLNELIRRTDYDSLSLEQVIVKARTRGDHQVLNNAAQAWNHAFLWQSMSPTGGGEPQGRLRRIIVEQYRSVDGFKRRFRDAAMAVPGSGWVWLVLDNDEIRIMPSSNADSPAGTNLVPLLNLDIWEHAYYLDYHAFRSDYIESFLDHVINWDCAARNLVLNRTIQAA